MKDCDLPVFHSNCDAAKLRMEPEIQHLLPPLGEAEQAGLEAEILQRGVLSPLIVWNDVLIDGHHRYAICQKHGLPFGVLSLDFDSLETAKLWAWRHQENRRNLTPYQRVEISLQFKPQLVAEAKERQGKRIDLADTNLPKNSSEGWETREKLDGSTALKLARSRFEGDAFVMRTDRVFLCDALSLGTLEFHFGGKFPVATTDGKIYAWCPTDWSPLPLESERPYAERFLCSDQH